MAFLIAGAGMVVGTLLFKPNTSLTLQYFGVLSLVLGGVSLFVFAKGVIRPGHATSRAHMTGRSLERLNLYMLSYMTACFLGGVFTAWTSIGIGEIVALWLIVVARRPLEIALAIRSCVVQAWNTSLSMLAENSVTVSSADPLPDLTNAPMTLVRPLAFQSCPEAAFAAQAVAMRAHHVGGMSCAKPLSSI